MKKVLLICLALLLLGSCAEPVLETFGNISGVVQDATSQEPLAGVQVLLTPTGYSQVTNENGTFQFDNLDVQEYTITFTRDGYQTYKHKVTVKPGLSSSVHVNMKPASQTPSDSGDGGGQSSGDGGQGTGDGGGQSSGDGGGQGSGDSGQDGSIAVPGGLVAYYTFDKQDVSDATEMEMDGTALGDPSFPSGGPNGNGYYVLLNGQKEQCLLIGYNLFKGLTHFSIAVWVRDFNPGNVISGIYTASYNRCFQHCYPRLYFMSDGKISFCTHNSYSEMRYAPVFSYPYSSLQTGAWHHLAITCANGELTLYVDGKRTDAMNSSYYVTDDNVSKIEIGGNGDGLFPDWFSGKVDNVRFYNKVITATDVKTIYDAEK